MNNTAHERLMAYYRAQTATELLNENYKNGVCLFCSLCFSPNCTHKVPRDSYQNAFDQLKYWQEIALAEARPILAHPEHPVPAWASLFSLNITKPPTAGFWFYPYVPNVEVIQIKRHETIRLPTGESVGRISAKTGYYYYHKGQLLCRFTGTKFEPNPAVLDATLPEQIGHWYAIPKVKNYSDFIRIGVREVNLK